MDDEMEIDLNAELAELLEGHGVQVQMDDVFIHTNLANGAKFKARSVYQEVDDHVTSRLDVLVVAENGEKILESFGDAGATIEEAIDRNFLNFSFSSLHPLLAALGCADEETLQQISQEEWRINERTWRAYIGNLAPKTMGATQQVAPPEQFFKSIEQEIRAQQLTNELHWFRSYYCQVEGEIVQTEFLMDNEPQDADEIFGQLPVIPNVDFYSCRNFIVLRAM